MEKEPTCVCVYMERNKTKENVQLEPPALRGRRQRITDFKQFIEANRKDRTANQIIAVYALPTGISQRTIQDYLKLFVEANVYMRPTRYVCEYMLLTPEEYKVALEEWQRKEEEERKKREEAEAKLYS